MITAEFVSLETVAGRPEFRFRIHNGGDQPIRDAGCYGRLMFALSDPAHEAEFNGSPKQVSGVTASLTGWIRPGEEREVRVGLPALPEGVGVVRVSYEAALPVPEDWGGSLVRFLPVAWWNVDHAA